MFDQLPKRRSERRVIVVVDEQRLNSLRDDASSNELLGSRYIALLSEHADLSNADEITKSLERKRLLVAGTMLVASPYHDGDYAPIDHAYQTFGHEKWSAISTLCGLLGARRLTVKVVEDSITNTRIEVNADGGKGPVKVEGKVKSSHLNEFAGYLDWHEEFEGGEIDLEGARKQLQECGLEAEPFVKSLVDARSHPGNLLLLRRVTVDLSRESERVIDAAMSVKIPTMFGVEGALKRARDSKAHYRVEFEVDFRAVAT